ncbi:MAG: AAA family ATPase [Bacteroidia bacterium]|nr:AAA family ATPase [Bacteroidia bacterium]
MIARITLENFFSFGQPTVIELNPGINVLVGINGSGKSNFLKAIKLLYEGVAGDGFEKIFLQDWGGFDTVSNSIKGQNRFVRLLFEFDFQAISDSLEGYGFNFDRNLIYEVTIFPSGGTGYYLKEKIYASGKPESGKSPFIYMEMENSEGEISAREDGKVGIQRYSREKGQVSFKSTELILRQISDPGRYIPLFTLKRSIEKLALYEYFDTSLKSTIRQPASFDIAERLKFNGQNLTSILSKIQNNYSTDYENIERYINKVNPKFKEIGFSLIGSKQYLVLRENNLAKAVPIEHISDGTLRYILLLAIFFNPGRGGLLCIEEPEIGLHPDMINSIGEAIKMASLDNSQIIIATHSPLLLNSFDLEEILIFEKDELNQTLVRTKSEEDFEDWNDNLLPGQLWLRGQLGGKRW